MEWQPIETAPDGKVLVVGWLDSSAGSPEERHEFDYKEDGEWVRHNEWHEHAHCVAPPGSLMPSYEAPYLWWLDVPEFPSNA